MLHVLVSVFDLRAGDVISYDGEELRCLSPVALEGEMHVTYFENPKGVRLPIYCTPQWEPTLVASARDMAARVAQALDRFDPAVRLEALRFFCPTCGKRACGEHR